MTIAICALSLLNIILGYRLGREAWRSLREKELI